MMTREKPEAIICTLEKAGLYRNKERYTIKEIPEIGATVIPEVETARWYLLRGEEKGLSRALGPASTVPFRAGGARTGKAPTLVLARAGAS
jgi:hypothetical protein